MPYAVTHILAPIILLSLIRDFWINKKTKKKFPLHYVMLAGLGGVLPDIDIVFSFIRWLFTQQNWWVHKTFTHSIFFPSVFLVLFLIFTPINAKAKLCNLTRHNLKLSTIFLMLAIGSAIHISLDTLLGTDSFLLYPFSNLDFGLNLFGLIPLDWGLLAALLDGVLLVIWLVYLELKHKISDFI